MRALVTGATGFVGRRLVGRLHDKNHDVVVLSRNAAKASQTLHGSKIHAFDWSADSHPPPIEAFDGVGVIFHLAGDSVSEGRWTAAKRRRIRDSRILGTRHLVDAIEKLKTRPKSLVSASAIGYYGSRGDDVLDESSPPGDDYLAKVCVGWEDESHRAKELGLRVVNPRIGLVLGKGGGAMKAMLPLFKLGAGGRMGFSGKQWWSWIHVDDLVSLMLFAAEHDELSGPANATAPNPATNAEFTRVLAKELGRPGFFHAPGPALQIALGGFAGVLLASQRVLPKAAQAAGFEFKYPDLQPALHEIVGRRK